MVGENISAEELFRILHQTLDTAHTQLISESGSHDNKGK